MEEGIFFILGAGASVDCGLPTFRGQNGLYQDSSKVEQILNSKFIYKTNENLKHYWEFNKDLYAKIKHVHDNEIYKTSDTYNNLCKLCQTFPKSFILSQNIDKIVNTALNKMNETIPIIDMHGSYDTVYCTNCNIEVNISYSETFQLARQEPRCATAWLEKMKCSTPTIDGGICNNWYKPNVVLFDEELPKFKVELMYRYLKTKPKYIVIIGTSLNFPYLRVFIEKAKMKGAKVIHINPDPKYKQCVKKCEEFICETASNGLEILIHRFENES
jgi:NAD-dependent deacetylase